MNTLDALKTMVRLYPGGLEAVALRLDKRPSTLEKELQHAPGFKFCVLDASAVAGMCREVNAPQRLAWINTEATNHGVRLLLPDGVLGPCGDVLELLGGAVREASDVTTAILARQGPHGRSPNARRAISKEISEAIDALQRLQHAVDAEAAQAGDLAAGG